VRLVALLLVAVAIGFAIGRLTAPEAGGLRGQRSAAQSGAPAPPAEPIVQAPAGTVSPPPPRSTEPPREPTDGRGFLEVSSEGAPSWEEIKLESPSLRGEWVSRWFRPEGPASRIEMVAGDYRILARATGDLSPRTWRFTIEPGTTVRVDLGAPPTPELFPIPEGLGRLDFEVYGLDGAPLGGAKLVVRRRGAWSEEDEEVANADGGGRLHLVPGEYLAAMGAQHKTVRVDPGREVRAVFRYADEGELEIEEPLRDIRLEPVLDAEGPHATTVYESAYLPSSLPRLVYVRPGRHRVRLADECRGRPPLGEVVIRPGVSTRFGSGLPRGSLAVYLDGDTGDLPPFSIAVTTPSGDVYRTGFHYVCVCSDDGCSTYIMTEIQYLPAGRYRVRLDAPGFDPAQTEGIVGTDETSVRLKVRKS